MTSILTPLYLQKSCPIFEEAANPRKSSKNVYKWRGWVSLSDFLNKRIAKGVAPDPHDFTVEAAAPRPPPPPPPAVSELFGFFTLRYFQRRKP
jgi:hypothetical protein